MDKKESVPQIVCLSAYMSLGCAPLGCLGSKVLEVGSERWKYVAAGQLVGPVPAWCRLEGALLLGFGPPGGHTQFYRVPSAFVALVPPGTFIILQRASALLSWCALAGVRSHLVVMGDTIASSPRSRVFWCSISVWVCGQPWPPCLIFQPPFLYLSNGHHRVKEMF